MSLRAIAAKVQVVSARPEYILDVDILYEISEYALWLV
jgi:hypothetical protein